MVKVKFFDKRVRGKFLKTISLISLLLSLLLMFVDIPEGFKITFGLGFLVILGLVYIFIWRRSNNLNKIDMTVERSKVTIKVGDIFKQPGYKVISFNEYFDTRVDNVLIAQNTLNGIFIEKHLEGSISDLDAHIQNYAFEASAVRNCCSSKKIGKNMRYQIGTICVYGDFLLTAFSKFDEENKASLTMPEYLEFLVNFWDKVNIVYAQKDVSTTIFGSGITRIKGHKTITDEELLKIMLWTFRISELRFMYPARLSVVIHEDKVGQINLFDIKEAWSGV